jgi:hypothetical protein
VNTGSVFLHYTRVAVGAIDLWKDIVVWNLRDARVAIRTGEVAVNGLFEDLAVHKERNVFAVGTFRREIFVRMTIQAILVRERFLGLG